MSTKFADMTIQEANQRLLFALSHIYDSSEAANIADLVMENITGQKRIDRVLNHTARMSAHMEQLMNKYIKELSIHKPVQYVLHEAWFYGMKFYVDENVLIPRPETEELVEWIVSEVKNPTATILDIGTGSGCIAVALKKKLPRTQVYACDISKKALEIAEKNAEANGTRIKFFQTDILNEDERRDLPGIDIIVSNPPYIPLLEKRSMRKNVFDHEPHLALFVEDNNPLVFYKAIAAIHAKAIYCEVHENLAHQVAALFKTAEIRKDMQGKERMIKAK